jgi:hypothetical protein
MWSGEKAEEKRKEKKERKKEITFVVKSEN